MASAEVQVELEDGEINDLEDGEIDEGAYLPGESIFSRLEPRQEEFFDERLHDCFEPKLRELTLRNVQSSSRRWESASTNSTRGRHSKGRPRAGYSSRASKERRLKPSPECARGQLIPGKSFYRRKESHRRPFQQQQNLPHGLPVERLGAVPVERLGAPYLNERGTVVNHNRPRLPHFGPLERQRSPVPSLNERFRQSYVKRQDFTSPLPVEEHRRSFPVEEDVDDYSLLLERHRLIQQQLEALEKQESLADDDIIDDTFVDIPIEEDDQSLERSREWENSTHSKFDSQDLGVDRNVKYFETHSENRAVEAENGTGGEELMEPKVFLPFKIRTLYSMVPSIQELSRKDLEQKQTKQEDDPSTVVGIDNNFKDLGSDQCIRTVCQVPKKARATKARRNRQRKRKRKISQSVNQSKTRNGKLEMPLVDGSNMTAQSHVDPHNELEARLMSLATSSVPMDPNERVEGKGDDAEKQRQRREKLKQWQERRLQNDYPGIRDQQQGSLTQTKKKASKLGVGSKRRTSGGDRKSEIGQGEKEREKKKLSTQLSRFDTDDYYEIPMEVESDSPDGPALPLIEETLENMPPPPPPLPNSRAGTVRMESYSGIDHSQQPILLYPGGYFATEQICPEWVAGPVPQAVFDDQQFGYEDYAMHNGKLVDVEPFYYIKHDHQHPQNMDTASQENSDEDDEAALRERLLKSLADKRKSKKAVREETKSLSGGSVPSSPRVESPKTVSNSSSAPLQAIKQQSKPQRKSRQVTFAPPKHDPVVIKLGEDTDTEESEATDTEPSTQAETDEKPRGKVNSGGLFGGLEMMIKEARKSAEASKVKEGQSVAQKSEVDQPCKTDLPPEPTTPDAMAHMPEQMKTEYRRLKEQLALRKSKPRQPLTNFNQEKADSFHETSSAEEQTETTTKDDHIKELQIWVRECEVSLANHRKRIKLDQSSLSNTIAELLLKKQSLEAQEAKVRKLQQQLEAAQKVTLASRLLIAKMRDQFKLNKERVNKKHQAASNLEEELLRTKSILSAMKRRQPMMTTSDTDRNGSENELLENVGNQNQKIMITPPIAEEMKSSLDAKLNKLLSVSKHDKKGDVQTKRKLEETSDSAEETVGKKAKPQVSSSQGITPSKTASGNAKKSAMAERIAQEKARLKKLEHELSERLKSYSKETARENKAAVANTGLSSAENGKSDVGIQKPVLTVTRENGPPLVEGPEQGNISSKDSDLEREPSAPIMEISIDDEQLECIRKLQAEKDKKGPQFPSFNHDIPLAAHEWSTICVSLPFESELKSLVREEDASCVGDGGRSLVESVAAGISGVDGVKDAPCPLEKYRSKLLYFKSYRLSSYFRTQEGFSLSSLTFTNKLDPLWPLCDFELKGKCNDEDCRFQHVITCKLLEEEMLQDLASYDLNLVVDGKSSKEQREGILSFIKSFAKQYQDKMSWEELCILLVSKIKVHRKASGPYHIFLKPRAWKVRNVGGKQVKFEEETVQDLGKGIKLSKKDGNHTQFAGKKTAIDTEAMSFPGESQELRYFVEEYNNMKTLEESLEKSPSNVALWIKLARLKLSQKVTSGQQKDLDTHNNNIRQALNTLSRGLEENTHSEELWLEYLDLYASQSNSVELREIFEQAVEFSPTYNIWWQYLEHSETYPDKKAVGFRLLSFLVANHSDPVELHSHRLLEVLLYLVQLELYCGHYRSALTIFQAALAKKTSRSYEVPDFSVSVLPSDYCLAWLAYIHVVEFHRLPALWFDPCRSRPSRMVSKEEFVFPWRPSQHSRASGEKLLGLFQDALKACVCLAKSPTDRYTVCLPLYKNLIALEIAYDRLSSARGICRHLLKDNYSDVFLWLCLAVLEQKINGKDAVEQVYQEAMDKCFGHAELAYSTARFYLEQNETQKAITALGRCVYHKFEDIWGSPKDEVHSLAVTMPRMDAPDPISLYRKLLSQPLPYDYKCPPLMPGVVSQPLGKEKVYVWLCYCLLLEISSSASAAWNNVTVESAFETAVHSPLERHDVQTLWTEYLFYQSSKALQEESLSSLSSQRAMEELVNRCLMCVSSNSPLPHSSCSFWQDYRFHNQVIRLSLSCLPKSHWSTTFDRYLKLFPGDFTLALWACQHQLKLNNLDQAKRISATFLSDNSGCITMWKVAIAIELKRNCVKEARKMYQQATEILPFAATLWKDFLMFEIAQSGNGSAVQELMGKCRQIGVDLEEFLNTLLGK